MENVKGKLSKKVLFKSWITWFFLHTGTNWNWEKMFTPAFTLSMAPVLKELYKDRPEEYKKRLSNHWDKLFNSEPQSCTIIHGIVIALEEQIARGEKIDSSAIDAVKSGMMGPLAGIGDSVIDALFNSMLLGIGISMALTGNFFGPIFFFLSYFICVTALSWYLFNKGYKTGMKTFAEMNESGALNTFIKGLNILGLVMIGALTASYVVLSTTLAPSFGGVQLSVQDTLDGILPGMLPLLFTLLIYWLMTKKRLSTIKVMLFIFVFGFIFTIIGVI